MVSKGLVGDLKAMPLTEVFQWIAFSNKNGELHLQKESDEVNIIFKNGKIVYVTSNIPHLLLGQLLLKYKILNKNTLVKGLSLQKQLKIPIGQVLVEYNFLDEASVKKILEIQVQEVVFHILNWESGFFIFDEKQVYDTMISIPVDFLILEGLRRKDEVARFLKVFSYGSVLALKDDNHPLKKYIDGKKNVGEIIVEKGGDEFETLEEIFTGIINGSIKIVSEKEFVKEEDPIVKFIVALELFNKNKIYESLKNIMSILSSGYHNEQIKKFYDNMVLYITKYFTKKFGGENTVFSVNRLKLLDEKVYISPVEGYVLSRIDEYPTVAKLSKVVNITKTELFLIIDKLHRLGLLMMKNREKNKTEVMSNDILSILLDIYKRELTGELEVVSHNLTGKLFFKQGRLIFLYSVSEEFSISNFLQEKGSIVFTSSVDASEDFITFFSNFMEKNNYSFDEIRGILDIYENMLFYEIISSDILSAIFVYDKTIPIEVKFDFNVLFMLFLALVNGKLKIKNEINKNSDYELLKDKIGLIAEFDNIGLIVNLLEHFDDGKISSDEIQSLNDYELSALNILLKLGYIKEYETPEFSLQELQENLNKFKQMTPEEIFGVKGEIDLDKIKQQYLKFSKKFHPDLVLDPQGKQLARDIFEIIKYAYDTLLQMNEKDKPKKKIDIKNILLAEQLLTSGKVYLNMGRLNDAVDSFIKAYNAFSNDEEIMIFYGYALIKKGEYEEGVKIMEMVGVEKFPEPELYAAIIEAYIKLGKKTEAKRCLDKALIKFPDKNKRFAHFLNKLK
ncbi:MAG: DUF4388 domain-containing protein [Calditerrivibrio sp.]|uniref:DUF4388 domain-containing protein n=1 Tax=Calditerrivibrio sp. TaxID=2792612 RepID=UPI003D1376D7